MTTVYTCQIAQRRYAVGIAVDITVKSATGLGIALMPTWDIVMGVKRGNITHDGYTERYLELLRYRYNAERHLFDELLQINQLTLMCYCKPGAFCHRHIAVNVLERIAVARKIPFERGGEIDWKEFTR